MREKLEMAWVLTYIALLLVGGFVVFFGLPIAIFIGATSGDWTWLLGWAVAAALWWIADRLGLVKPIND